MVAKKTWILLTLLLLFHFFLISCGDNEKKDEKTEGSFAELKVDDEFNWKTVAVKQLNFSVVSQDKPIGPAVVTVFKYDEEKQTTGSRILKVVLKKEESLNFALQLPEIEEKVVIKATYYGKSKEQVVNVADLASLTNFDIYTGERPGDEPEKDSLEEVDQ